MKNALIFVLFVFVFLALSAFSPIINHSSDPPFIQSVEPDTLHNTFIGDSTFAIESFTETDLKSLLPKSFSNTNYSLSEIANAFIEEARSSGYSLIRKESKSTRFKDPIKFDFYASLAYKYQMVVISEKNAPYVCLEVVDEGGYQTVHSCETKHYDSFSGVGGISGVDDAGNYTFYGWAHYDDTYNSPKYETYVLIFQL